MLIRRLTHAEATGIRAALDVELPRPQEDALCHRGFLGGKADCSHCQRVQLLRTAVISALYLLSRTGGQLDV